MVITVAGSKSKKQFENIRLTMKSYFDVFDINYSIYFCISDVDYFGEIHKHPTALKEAFRLGKELITDKSPPPPKPIIIELP
jgi:hypothetical protein